MSKKIPRTYCLSKRKLGCVLRSSEVAQPPTRALGATATIAMKSTKVKKVIHDTLFVQGKRSIRVYPQLKKL